MENKRYEYATCFAAAASLSALLLPLVLLSSTTLPHSLSPVITTDSPRCFITTISELSAGLLIIAIQRPPPNLSFL